MVLIDREPREEPETRLGSPGRGKRTRGTSPPDCCKAPWSAWPCFRLVLGLPFNPSHCLPEDFRAWAPIMLLRAFKKHFKGFTLASLKSRGLGKQIGGSWSFFGRSGVYSYHYLKVLEKPFKIYKSWTNAEMSISDFEFRCTFKEMRVNGCVEAVERSPKAF